MAAKMEAKMEAMILLMNREIVDCGSQGGSQGGSDDSFDEHLSQIQIEEERQDMTDVSMSPVLKKRRTSIHSHKTKMKPSGRYC